jgi:hypothetical protein
MTTSRDSNLSAADGVWASFCPGRPNIAPHAEGLRIDDMLTLGPAEDAMSSEIRHYAPVGAVIAAFLTVAFLVACSSSAMPQAQRSSREHTSDEPGTPIEAIRGFLANVAASDTRRFPGPSNLWYVNVPIGTELKVIQSAYSDTNVVRADLSMDVIGTC